MWLPAFTCNHFPCRLKEAMMKSHDRPAAARPVIKNITASYSSTQVP